MILPLTLRVLTPWRTLEQSPAGFVPDDRPTVPARVAR